MSESSEVESRAGADGRPNPRFVTLVKAAITVLAVAGAVAHLVWPDLKVDAILIGLLLVAAVPWLGYILETLELPGGTKLKFREMERRIEATEEGARAARVEATSASQRVEVALVAIERPSVVVDRGQVEIEAESEAEAELSSLIEVYNEVRQTQESGPARTSAMTRIVGQMCGVSKELHDFDFGPKLESQDGGERLAGYARLFVRPEAAQLSALVEAVTNREQTPFGQYWGVQALSRVIAVASPSESSAVVPQLRAYLGRLREGTDRHYELTKILRSLGAGVTAT